MIDFQVFVLDNKTRAIEYEICMWRMIHSASIEAWTVDENFNQWQIDNNAFYNAGNDAINEILSRAKPTKLIVLPQDTGAAIQNNCMMENGKSAIVFSHDILKGNYVELEKASRIWGLSYMKPQRIRNL